jgi:endogenous inhibitor of DNA gyrase (YacG/DUF329 family)
MVKEVKIRKCRFCGKVLSEDDSQYRDQCMECSMKRLQRWYALQAEAKAKFDEEWR